MRRFLALIAVPLLACVILAGCGSSNTGQRLGLTVFVVLRGRERIRHGDRIVGQLPKVSIPKAKAGSKLTVRTLIQGTGGDLHQERRPGRELRPVLLVGNQLLAEGEHLRLNSPTLIPQRDAAWPGGRAGRPEDRQPYPGRDPARAGGYGTSGNSQLGVPAATTLVFVIDLLKAYSNTAGVTGKQVSDGGGTLPTVSAKAGSAPTLTFPSSSPPSGLVTTTLIKGSGPKIVKGDYVIAQYVGYIWRTKKVFGSSWASGSPFGFVIGASPEQVIPGWDKGLIGQTVGSRVMLSIPPADGYGSAGQSSAGIKGTDTLVFVVDLIDALKS